MVATVTLYVDDYFFWKDDATFIRDGYKKSMQQETNRNPRKWDQSQCPLGGSYCDAGMTFDDGKCVLKVGSDGLCGTGTIYDATTKTCKVDSDGLCGDGTLWEDGKCKNFLNASTPDDGEQFIYFSQFCGDTTTAFRGFCESTQLSLLKNIKKKCGDQMERCVQMSGCGGAGRCSLGK